MPTFDEKDETILAQRMADRKGRNGPLIGDFVLFPDGHYERFSHDWGDGFQTSEGGSFYLSPKGYASFSGGLNGIITNEHFAPTGEVKDGAFWFFHHNEMRAHNGVYITAPCKVYTCDIDREWRLSLKF